MLSQLRLCEILLRSSSRLSVRCLTSSASWRMPRRARLQETGEEEDMTSTEHEKWVDFINRSRTGSLSDELKSFTNFGSVRLDHDNTPRIEGIEGYRGEQFGKTSEKTAEKTEKVEINNWLGLIVEEDDGHTKYSAFNQSKNSSLEPENAQSILVENRQKSTDPSKRVENSTIPVNFHQSEPPSQSREADLNYVDNLYFKESYDQFDSVTANRAREVSVDPSVMMTREQTAETDLNYIDSIYFPPVSPDTSDGVTELKPDRSEPERKFGTSSEDLNSIDDQYFKISTEPVESHFAVDQRTLDTTVSGDLKGIEALSILSNEEKVSKKKKKKQKDKARLSTEGTALEYVRELRKENQNLPGKVDPSAMIGKSLQDRFLAAASNLQWRPVTSRAGSEEEEEGETVQTVNNVKKFKPPDLEKYTRFEIRDLLFSKILYDNHDIVAIWKPYGLPMFTTESNNKTTKKKKTSYSMEYFKADLATKLGAETLHEVHRLDSTTTGVLLYAKTKEVELMLRKLFKERRIQKTYLAICNGTPVAESGVIDIPVGEAKIQSRMRMTLRPDYSSSKIITNKKNVGKTAETAITEYKV